MMSKIYRWKVKRWGSTGTAARCTGSRICFFCVERVIDLVQGRLTETEHVSGEPRGYLESK